MNQSPISDTPETDALYFSVGIVTFYDMAGLCKQLERQRDEARALNKELVKQLLESQENLEVGLKALRAGGLGGMREVWKDVDGLPGYRISSYGRLKRGTVLVLPAYDTTGCAVKTVYGPRHPFTVRYARLVGAAFCSDFQPHLRPTFKNGKRHDCRATNLQWVPQAQVTGIPFSKTPRPQRALQPTNP